MVLHVLFFIIMQTLKYSCDSLPLAKALTYQNVIILIKSVFNKDKNNYHFKIFSEQCSYK